MLEILVGTNNKNKLEQFRKIFEENIPDAKIYSLSEIGISEDVEEDADNLTDNAKKKAEYYAEKSGMITLADDTGLFVDALGGEPGMHAKRWHTGTEKERNEKLLNEMKNISERQRNCRYKGVLAIYNPRRKKFWCYEGATGGSISFEPKGENGFGYDPIFISKEAGKHFAELSMEEKNKLSHRGKGIQELAKNLGKIL